MGIKSCGLREADARRLLSLDAKQRGLDASVGNAFSPLLALPSHPAWSSPWHVPERATQTHHHICPG